MQWKTVDVHQALSTGPKDCMSCPAPCKTRPGQMTCPNVLWQNGCYILTYTNEKTMIPKYNWML